MAQPALGLRMRGDARVALRRDDQEAGRRRLGARADPVEERLADDGLVRDRRGRWLGRPRRGQVDDDVLDGDVRRRPRMRSTTFRRIQPDGPRDGSRRRSRRAAARVGRTRRGRRRPGPRRRRSRPPAMPCVAQPVERAVEPAPRRQRVACPRRRGSRRAAGSPGRSTVTRIGPSLRRGARARRSRLLPATVSFATTSGCLGSVSAATSSVCSVHRPRASSRLVREDRVPRARDAVLVRAADDLRDLVEVEDRRRRGDLPLERVRAPRVARRERAADPAGDHVVEEDERSRRRARTSRSR